MEFVLRCVLAVVAALSMQNLSLASTYVSPPLPKNIACILNFIGEPVDFLIYHHNGPKSSRHSVSQPFSTSARASVAHAFI